MDHHASERLVELQKLLRVKASTPQIRGARALLGLSQQDLADLAKIGLATVKRIEAAAQIRGAAETLWKIQAALEKAGVEFIPGDETKGPGVRLKSPGKAKPKRLDRRGASG